MSKPRQEKPGPTQPNEQRKPSAMTEQVDTEPYRHDYTLPDNRNRLWNGPHNLHDRMRMLRFLESTPDWISGSQRKFLRVLLTFVPFDLDEGWTLSTSEIAAAAYGDSSPGSSANTRKYLGQLERLGVIDRQWQGSKHDHNEDATYWVRLKVIRDLHRERKTSIPSPGDS